MLLFRTTLRRFRTDLLADVPELLLDCTITLAYRLEDFARWLHQRVTSNSPTTDANHRPSHADNHGRT